MMRRASVSASSRPISARVAGRQPPLLHERLHALRQLQQAQRIGDVARGLADDVGQLLLAVAEAVDELAVARRLLDGVEVGALHVLDDGELEHLAVGELAHDDRHRVQPGHLRRAPAALAGDDLVVLACAGSGRTMIGCTSPCADRVRQLGELLLAESCAWVEPAGAGRDASSTRRASGGAVRLRMRRGRR